MCGSGVAPLTGCDRSCVLDAEVSGSRQALKWGVVYNAMVLQHYLLDGRFLKNEILPQHIEFQFFVIIRDYILSSYNLSIKLES